MKPNLKRILIAALIMAVSISAGAGYLGRGQNPPPQSAKPAQSGEDSRAALIISELAALLTPAGVQVVAGFQVQETDTFRQVRVHWAEAGREKLGVNAEQGVGTLTVKQSSRGAGGLPRRRSLELAETEVLIVGVDKNARLLWWHAMTDPRLLRAETVKASGEISGRVSYLSQVDFSIAYPDDPAIKELRLYHPEWNGKEFRLTSLGVLTVP